MSFPAYFPENREAIAFNIEKHQKRVRFWQIFFIIFFVLVIAVMTILLIIKPISCNVNSDCPVSQVCGTDNVCH